MLYSPVCAMESCGIAGAARRERVALRGRADGRGCHRRVVRERDGEKRLLHKTVGGGFIPAADQLDTRSRESVFPACSVFVKLSGELRRTLLVEVGGLLKGVRDEQVLFVLKDGAHDVHGRRKRNGRWQGVPPARPRNPRVPRQPRRRPRARLDRHPAAAHRPPPPRPNWGMAKPVGTTIDGVPVMFVTEVFSRGVTRTSYFENRSHICSMARMRMRLALT